MSRHRIRRSRLLRLESSSVVAAFAVALPLVPLVLVIAAALDLDVDAWQRLINYDAADSYATPVSITWLDSLQSVFQGLTTSKVTTLLLNTIGLAALTGLFAFILALPAARLFARHEFFASRWLSRLLVLPVAIPPYLFAVIYSGLDNQSWVFLGVEWSTQAVFSALADSVSLLSAGKLHQGQGLYSITGAAAVLAIASYPYLYLLLKQRLQTENSNWHDGAKLLGIPMWQRFWRISLPWLRPAIIGGLTVITLHVLADYGTVKILRVETFTKEVFKQVDGANYELAAAVSVILLLTGIAIVAMGWLGQNSKSAKDVQREFPKIALRGRRLLIAYAGIGLLLLPTVILPMGWLGYWAWQTLSSNPEWLSEVLELLNDALASVGFAAMATIIAMLAGFAMTYYRWRYGTLAGKSFLSLGTIGFVLPGPIVALGLLVFAADIMPWLLNSFLLFALALAVRYLPVAIQGEQAALAGFNPRMLEAAQIHGLSPLNAIRRILLPAISPALLVAAVLVGIEILKDLPIALLMKPIGVDTLPLTLWSEATQESETLAAPASLLLVLLSLPLVAILDRSGKR